MRLSGAPARQRPGTIRITGRGYWAGESVPLAGRHAGLGPGRPGRGRRQQAGDSRAPLRAARDTFDALGADAWAERARRELRAAGERSGRPAPRALDLLAPQELHIARLAARGLTNREIGQQLYLSQRTVRNHLYRIFPKLGITSRTELAAVVGAAPDSM